MTDRLENRKHALKEHLNPLLLLLLLKSAFWDKIKTLQSIFPFVHNFRMWAECTHWILGSFSLSLLSLSVHWVKVRVYCAYCLLTASERVCSLPTGDRYWSGVRLKEVMMKEGKRWGGWGVRTGWETGKSQWPGHALNSHQDAAKSETWLHSFDPGHNAPAGGLRICPLPMGPFPCLQGITDPDPCE